jgi:hypothetical protein
MFKMMSGILQMPIIFSKAKRNRSVVLDTIIVLCELKQEYELIRRRQSKSGKSTYRVPMNTQFGGCVNQTHRIFN